jgi:hypothetical protein
MHEAMHYTREVMEMLPARVQKSVALRPEVVRCSDMRELLSIIFGSRDRRLAYEAQRKLCLTKLFFDIDHSWEVQRGTEHKDFLEKVIQEELFSHVASRRKVDITYAMREDGQSMEYAEGTGEGEECRSFDLQQIEMLREGRPIRIRTYYYSCRFKREVIPYLYRSGERRYEFGLSEMFPGMSRRRSASIASKMIRKGENDPRAIQDLIGLMFIVENQSELEDLKESLFDVFGGFFRFKNVVDTVAQPEDQLLLNPQSGAGYKVYKAELDVLYNSPRNRHPMPYTFNAEIQLYTLENYLRTLHTSHYANHQALKRRQFLSGIVPYLFPESIYGSDTIEELLAHEDLTALDTGISGNSGHLPMAPPESSSPVNAP